VVAARGVGIHVSKDCLAMMYLTTGAKGYQVVCYKTLNYDRLVILTSVFVICDITNTGVIAGN